MKTNFLIKYHKKFNILIFFVAICLAFFLVLNLQEFKSNEKLNNFALGTNNQVDNNSYTKKKSCDLYYEKIAKCLEKINLNKFNNNFIWLGNSQLYAINDKKNNDLSSGSILSKKLEKKNINLVSIGLPNASLEEFQILSKYINNHSKIDLLILPVFFDDLREGKSRNLILNLEKKNSKISKNDIKNSSSEITELFIKNFLNSEFQWTEKIKYIQSNINIFLYKLRNTIFGINPISKRGLIRSNYIKNVSSLKELIINNNNNKVKLLIYIPPLRMDIDYPYYKDQYLNFKKDIEELLSMHNTQLFNLENIVPGIYWGQKDTINFKNKQKQKLDFMHFKGEGHRLLADEIFNLILKYYDF